MKMILPSIKIGSHSTKTTINPMLYIVHLFKKKYHVIIKKVAQL
uniref:Uncharacterized protein n=1 Tax=Arundo donax TaxID=35708 RepID=A0A0A9F642_ARUDO